MPGLPLTASVTRYADAGWLFLIPLLPLLGAAINGLFGRRLQARLGKSAVHVVAIACMLGAAGLAIAAVAQLATHADGIRCLYDRVFPMLALGRLHVDFALALDPLSAVLLLVITLIGTLIHVYAAGYMHDDPAYWRFFAYLNLFVFSMLLLVLGDSFVTLFFGWEGVGLCSYLLIGFWYHERKNASAGLKAFIVNRVGDWGLLTGVFLLFWGLGGSWSAVDRHYYPDDPMGREAALAVRVPEAPGHPATVTAGPTLSFRELHDQLAVTDEAGAHPIADELTKRTVWGAPLVLVIALCLFFGACGKSAQIPLYVWLPDAMAGPTPVSALIHAATMVTAGVYLLARTSFLFALSPTAMTVVATIGALTALLAATIALFQHDIKKVLAYSTISQLGFMFLAAGVGAWWVALFHVVTHACFKACLFLGAGSVIHGMHRLTHARHHGHAADDADGHAQDTGDDEHLPARLDPRRRPDPTDPQDLRNMGGLGALMPRTRRAYFVACWAIAGFPWAAGFFSKDEILAQAFARSPVLWALGLTTALCTSFYAFRTYYLAFEARPASRAHQKHVAESPRVMTGVLTTLAALCLVVGPALGLPRLFTHHETLLGRWLEPVTTLATTLRPGAESATVTEWLLMLASLAAAGLGWLGARALYRDLGASSAALVSFRNRYDRAHAFVFEKYRIDELYDRVFVRTFRGLARFAAWFDAHVLDALILFVASLARAAAALSDILDRHLVDGAVHAVSTSLLGGGRAVSRLQTGRINNYVLGVAVGIVILIVLTSWL